MTQNNMNNNINAKPITYLSNEGYHIDVDSITKEKLNEIMNELTVYPNKLDATKQEIEESKFKLYKYSNDRLNIIVPRYYGISRFGIPSETKFDPEDVEFSFNKVLRDKQKDVSEKCINYILNNGGGLLSVPCGFGKTVCALYIASRLGLKTLIVVHKSNLLGQWIERIKEFLNIDHNKIGIIRQKKCEVDDKDIVVGMIQTISKKEYDNVFNRFGLVIYDEAHHVACKFFSKSLMKTGTQYTFALTATPYRGDGLIKVMYWFLGGTIYREKIKVNKNVISKMVYFKSTNKKLFALKRKWMKGQMRPDTGKMITNMCHIDKRNETIINIINKIRRNEPNRKILVLSGRKKHLQILKNSVDESIKKDIDNKLIESDEIMSCMYTGESSIKEKLDAETGGDIIFATYDMAHEGLDIKHLNTVILASPKKDVVQSIGRIMRKILDVGDIRPMIIDICDDIEAIGNWVKIRKNVYTKCKYEIENYYLIDDKFTTYQEYTGEIIDQSKLHHHNICIHNMINETNKELNSIRNDMIRFNIKSSRMDIYDEYNVYDNYELTDLNDILFVPKLTERDIDRIILKDASQEINNLNLNQDIQFDKDEETDSNKDIITKAKLFNPIPTKKLFR